MKGVKHRVEENGQQPGGSSNLIAIIGFSASKGGTGGP